MAIIIQTEKELRKNLFEIFSKMNSNEKNRRSILKTKYINPLLKENETVPMITDKEDVEVDENDLTKFLSQYGKIYEDDSGKDKELLDKLKIVKSSWENSKGNSGNDEIEQKKIIAILTDMRKRNQSVFNWDPDASFMDNVLDIQAEKFSDEKLMGNADYTFAVDSLRQGAGNDNYEIQKYLDSSNIMLSFLSFVSHRPPFIADPAIRRTIPVLNLVDAFLTSLSAINRFRAIMHMREFNKGGQTINVGVENGGSFIQKTIAEGELDSHLRWQYFFLALEILGSIPLLGVISSITLDIARNANKLWGQMGNVIRENPTLVRYIDSNGKTVNKTFSTWVSAKQLEEWKNADIHSDEYKLYKAAQEKAAELGIDITNGAPPEVLPVKYLIFKNNEIVGNAVTDALIIQAETQVKMSLTLGLDVSDEILDAIKNNPNILNGLANKLIFKLPNDIDEMRTIDTETLKDLYGFIKSAIDKKYIPTPNRDDFLMDIYRCSNFEQFKDLYYNRQLYNKHDEIKVVYDRVLKIFNEVIKPKPTVFFGDDTVTNGPIINLYKNQAEFDFDAEMFHIYKHFDTLDSDQLSDKFIYLKELWDQLPAGGDKTPFGTFKNLIKNKTIGEFLYRKNASLYLRRINEFSSFVSSKYSSSGKLSTLATKIENLNLGKSGNVAAKNCFSAKQKEIEHVLKQLMGSKLNVSDQDIAQVVMVLQKMVNYNFELMDLMINPGNKKASEFLKNLGIDGALKQLNNSDLIKNANDFDITGVSDNLIVKIPEILDQNMTKKTADNLFDALDVKPGQYKPLVPMVNELTQNMQVLRDYLLQLRNNVSLTDLGKLTMAEQKSIQNLADSLIDIVNKSLIDSANAAAGPYGLNVLGPINKMVDGVPSPRMNTALFQKIRNLLAPDFLDTVSEVNKIAGVISFWNRFKTLFLERRIGAIISNLVKNLLGARQGWSERFRSFTTWISGADFNLKNIEKLTEYKTTLFAQAGIIGKVFTVIFDFFINAIQVFLKRPELFVAAYKTSLYCQLFISIGTLTPGLVAASLILGCLNGLTTGVTFRFLSWLITSKSPTFYNLATAFIKNAHTLSVKFVKYFARFKEKYKEISETERKIKKIEELPDSGPEFVLNYIFNIIPGVDHTNNIRERIYKNLVNDNQEKLTATDKFLTSGDEDVKLILNNDFKFANITQDQFDLFLGVLSDDIESFETTSTQINVFGLTQQGQDSLTKKYFEFMRKLSDESLRVNEKIESETNVNITKSTKSDKRLKVDEKDVKSESYKIPNEKLYGEEYKLHKILFFFYLRQTMIDMKISNEIRAEYLNNVTLKNADAQCILKFKEYLGFHNDYDLKRLINFFHVLLQRKNIFLKFKKTFKPTNPMKGVLNLDAMLTGGLYNVKFFNLGNEIKLADFDLTELYKPTRQKYNFEQKVYEKDDKGQIKKNKNGEEITKTVSKKSDVDVLVPYLRQKGSSNSNNSQLFEDLYSLPFEDAEFTTTFGHLVDINHYKKMLEAAWNMTEILWRLGKTATGFAPRPRNEAGNEDEGGYLNRFDSNYILNGNQPDELMEESVRKIIRKNLLLENDYFTTIYDYFTGNKSDNKSEIQKSIISQKIETELLQYGNELQYYSNIPDDIDEESKIESFQRLNDKTLNKDTEQFNKKYQEALNKNDNNGYNLKKIDNQFSYFKNFSVNQLISNPNLVNVMIKKASENILEFNKIKNNDSGILSKLFGQKDLNNIELAFKKFEEDLVKNSELLKEQLTEYAALKNSSKFKDRAQAQKILSAMEKGGIYNPNRGVANDELVSAIDKNSNLKLKDKFDILNTKSNQLLFFLQSNPITSQSNAGLKQELLNQRNKAMVDYINLNLNLLLKNINNDASLILNSLNNFMKQPYQKPKLGDTTSTFTTTWSIGGINAEKTNETIGKSVKEYYSTLFSQQIEIGKNNFDFNKKGVIEQYQNIIKNIFPATGLVKKEMLSPTDKIIGFYYNYDALNKELSNIGLDENKIDKIYGDHLVINRLIILSNHGIDALAKQQQNEYLKNLMYIYELDINDLYIKPLVSDIPDYVGIPILNKNSFIQKTFSKKYNIISPSTLKPEEFTYSFNYYQINTNHKQKIYVRKNDTEKELSNLFDVFTEFMPNLLTGNKK